MSEKKCPGMGPGYSSPLDAMKNGKREKLLYVVTVQPNLNDKMGDYLSTIDIDPESNTFCKIIHRTFTNQQKDELHHSGWNTCSSCHKIDNSDCKLIPKRNKLILPCLNSNNIYIMDTSNEKKPEIHKVISGDVLIKNDVSAPHTSHCLANGNIMISTMGDANDNAKGDFILFDPEFNCIGTWTKGEKAVCGYDFWYQPYFDIMIASEWSAPNLFKRGFQVSDLVEEKYGKRLNFYKWSEQKLIQTIHLGDQGIAPLEVRFLHNPKKNQGFVGCALFANMFRFFKNDGDKEYQAEKVIDIPAKKVDGWILPEMNGMITDILLSLDDKFLYFSNWFHGDVRQYDISDPAKPKLTGQVFLGGLILSDSGVKVTEDKELTSQPDPVFIKNRRLYGGPQMLQLSLDGKRLYVSSSLYSPWDKQFYPDMVKYGGTICQLDIDVVNGGMKINEKFLVDFGKEINGPCLPHEMRYPGGDCTSDIFLAE